LQGCVSLQVFFITFRLRLEERKWERDVRLGEGEVVLVRRVHKSVPMPIANRPRRNQPAREEVRLRKVVPGVPDLGSEPWRQLMEDLTKMGCADLLEKP